VDYHEALECTEVSSSNNVTATEYSLRFDFFIEFPFGREDSDVRPIDFLGDVSGKDSVVYPFSLPRSALRPSLRFSSCHYLFSKLFES
jgi:hypothetical protein